MKTTRSRSGLFRHLALALGTSALLAACGGGGGGGSSTTPTPTPTPTPPPTPTGLDTSALQGRWNTTSGTNAFTAIILPGASNTATAWVLAQNLSQLNVLGIDSQAAVSGKIYALSGSTAPVAVSGSVQASLSTSPKTLSVSGLGTTALALTQQDALATPAVQADIVGTWNGSAGGGTQTLSWSVSAGSGAIAGVSTTGCTYTGTLSAQTSASAYTAHFVESCPGSTLTTFDGIATLNGDKSRLTVVGLTIDQSKAIVLPLNK
ncbi:hypothetical protein [Zoogloea sp. LCSB751]|uniref:hypothetical protein n=1 Tax=Zoogloea sp. LCSB751 TaxID=1965277 RepID=UPI0009A53B1C|nr:hypothetical protein [Zoogloea sp. LCSB751]